MIFLCYSYGSWQDFNWHVQTTLVSLFIAAINSKALTRKIQLDPSPECASICCSISLRLCSMRPSPFSSTSNFTTSPPYRQTAKVIWVRPDYKTQSFPKKSSQMLTVFQNCSICWFLWKHFMNSNKKLSTSTDLRQVYYF